MGYLRNAARDFATGAGEMIHHIADWAEAYVWAPLMILSILGSAEFIYKMTGHRPVEDMSWVMDYSSKGVECILIILFAAILKQSGSTYFTQEQRLAHPILSVFSDLFTLCAAGLFTFVFLR